MLVDSLRSRITIDLLESAQKLAQKATEIFASFPHAPDDLPYSEAVKLNEYEELSTSFCVFQISLAMLQKRTDSGEQQQAICDCIRLATYLAVGYTGISPARQYIKRNLLDMAYEELVNKGIPQDLAVEDLEIILPIALQKNLSLALKLLSHNAPIKKLSLNEKTALARHALSTHSLEQNNDRILSSLITAKCTINGQTLLDTVSKDMEVSVRALLQRDIDLKTTSEGGNTALHTAYLHGNITIIGLLLKRISPLTKNSAHMTPLMNLLQNNPSQETVLQVIGELSPSPAPPPSQRDQNALKSLLPNSSVVLPENLNWVELSCLLDSEPLQQKVFSLFFREDIEATCEMMREKYSEDGVNAFFLRSFAINRLHLQTGCIEFDPSKPPENNPSISELLGIFDTFEVYAVKESLEREQAARKREDVDKAEREKQTREAKKRINADRRMALNTFLTNITEKTPMLGVPETEKERTAFYNTIELEIKHIIHKTLYGGDCEPDVIKGVLREFIEASGLCGPKYYAIALEQYLRVCIPNELTFSIAEYRKELLWSVICEKHSNDEHSVHRFNRALYELGKELGIPGYRQMQQSRDRFSHHEHYELAPDIKDRFWQLYTPENILLERYLPLIKNQAISRNNYLALHKKHTPWKEGFYASLRATVKKTPDIKEFLAQHGIVQDQGQTVEQAIKAHQIDDRLEQFVYKDDSFAEFRFEALVFLFEKLGVITPKTRWRDKSKEIEPILEAPTLVRRVLDFVGIR